MTSLAVLRDHTHCTHNTVGLLWTRNQLDAETSENTQSSQKTNTHAPGGRPHSHASDTTKYVM